MNKIYEWFWYHTEFWIARKLQRRPYTFIMRDWIYPHMVAFWIMVLVWYLGLFVLSYFHPHWSLVLGILTAMLVAHLVWGSKWLKGEQEYPTYNPDEEKDK